MRGLICWRRRTKDISLDLDEHERVTTYNGLESILNSCSYENETSNSSCMSRADGCPTTSDSLDEDDASSFSSVKDPYGSFSSQCLMSSKQEEEQALIEWEPLHSKKGKAPITNTMHFSDVEAMKERFAKLLLGEDVSGGTRGISTALALSNAIMNLSASVFGELWKLEPLSEERKNKWRREMDWLLSPTNCMVELVPAKQNGGNGQMLEIMTSKARSDVHMNLPALRKLDSMLIEVLDSMVDTEFWYVERGSRAEERGRLGSTKPSKKWWLPSPWVPDSGLSASQRKRLGIQGKFVHQVLKAAKSINEQVLLQMPIPTAVKDALPKSGRTSLGEDLYQAIAAASYSVQEVLLSLDLKNEHSVLDTVNRLEGAILAWKKNLSEDANKRSPMRHPWHFTRDSGLEHEKIAVLVERAGTLKELLKTRFPNLPHTFIDVTKVQYSKDVGHAIVEAYSRVLVSVSFSVLSRIGDILQEDDLKKPSTPIANLKFDFLSDVYLAGITKTPPGHIKGSPFDQMKRVDGQLCNRGKIEECFSEGNARIKAVSQGSPFRYSGWCYGRARLL